MLPVKKKDTFLIGRNNHKYIKDIKCSCLKEEDFEGVTTFRYMAYSGLIHNLIKYDSTYKYVIWFKDSDDEERWAFASNDIEEVKDYIMRSI